MMIEEIRANRVSIFLEALDEGMSMFYKLGWFIFYKDGVLYQTSFSEHLERDVTHKSDISINALLEHIHSLSDDELKNIYGGIRLLRMQRKIYDREYQ